MIIIVDFDGTCVENKFPELGASLPGAVETISDLLSAGHEIVIWTCRNERMLPGWQMWDTGIHDGLAVVRYWIEENFGGHPNRGRLFLNENTPTAVSNLGTDTRKVWGSVYIDDKNFGGFPGWDKVREVYLSGKPYEQIE